MQTIRLLYEMLFNMSPAGDGPIKSAIWPIPKEIGQPADHDMISEMMSSLLEPFKGTSPCIIKVAFVDREASTGFHSHLA